MHHRNFLVLVVTLVFLGVLPVSGQNTALVTNTQNTGTGSLRAAIIQANQNPGTEIIFNIPTADAGFDNELGVFIIEVESALPSLNRAETVVDGSTQTQFTGNTNTTQLGTAIEVGTNGVAISTLDAPEIYLKDVNNVWMGFGISAPNCTVKNIGILGFDFGLRVFNAPNATVENIVIGSAIENYELPSNELVTRNHGFYVESSPNGSLKNAIVSWAGAIGLFFNQGNAGWLVDKCEFRGNGRISGSHDGIDIARSSLNVTITNCFITENRGCGIDMFNGNGNNTIENNTITENGKSGLETPGIRVFGNNNTIKNNIIANNFGAGVMVTSNVHRAFISENSFTNNGGVIGENGAVPSGQIGIDLLGHNDRADRGQTPFVTLNDRNDNDQGANMLQNFPVLDFARIQNGNLIVEGWTRPNTDIEFYVGSTNGANNFPQGHTYLFTRTESSQEDLGPNAPSSYGPGPVNGVIVGEDRTKRFRFEVPVSSLEASLNAGLTLTAIAHRQGNTSEFSNGALITNSGALSPVLECVVPNEDGTFTAYFGYNNLTGSVQNIPVGNNNRFTPNPQDRGQPTNFELGRQISVFEVVFSGSNLIWTLNNRTATASANSHLCSCDIGVRKSINNQDPNEGDPITFTILAANNSSNITGTGLEITDNLSDSFQYISHSSSQGSFDVNSGIWAVGALAPGAEATLEISVLVLDEGENTAFVSAFNLNDRNPLNDQSTVNISFGSSSGGNDAGIESNGNMANKMALRNFNKFAKNKVTLYENYRNLNSFLGEPSSRNEGSSLASYLPTQGPQNTNAFVTSPEELTQITNAQEIISLDFFTAENRRLGAIYATNSNNGEIYEHTKVICDRLNGATLETIDLELIDDKVFILSKLVQHNGAVDYAISFSALKKQDGTFEIDTKWNNEFFEIAEQDSVFNFQIWSINRAYTRALVSEVLDRIENTGETTYLNYGAAALPKLYARKAFYENGQISLEMANEATDANRVYFFGSTAQVENGARSPFLIQDDLNPQALFNYSLNSDIIFDAGFSISNGLYGGMDVLYVADGPWGMEFEDDGYLSDTFEIEPALIENPYHYNLPRNPSITGQLKTGVSIFRMLKVNSIPVNLTGYNAVGFSLVNEGTESFEIALLHKGVTQWADQFRYTFSVEPGYNEIEIPFESFTTNNGELSFDPTDIFAVTLVSYGNNLTFEPIEVSIENLHFFNTTTVGINERNINENEFKVFPNPAKNHAQIQFNLNTNERLTFELYNITGSKITTIADKEFINGEQILNLNTEKLTNGMYFVRVIGKNKNATLKFLVEN